MNNNPIVTFEMKDGDVFYVELYPEIAPNTVNNFISLVNKGFYNKQALRLIQEKSKRISCTKEEKCLTCEYESNCPYCIGGCFAEYGDFIRTTHSCEIIKLQCRWRSGNTASDRNA